MKVVKRVLVLIFIFALFSIELFAAYQEYGVDFITTTYSGAYIRNIPPTKISGLSKGKAGNLSSTLPSDSSFYNTQVYYGNNTSVKSNIYLEYADAVRYTDSSGKSQKLTLRIYPYTYNSNKYYCFYAENNLQLCNIYYDEMYTYFQYRFYDSSGNEVGFKGVICFTDLDTKEGIAIYEDASIKNYYRKKDGDSYVVAAVKKGANHSSNDNNPFYGTSITSTLTKNDGTSKVAYFFGKEMSTGTNVAKHKVWLEVSTTPSDRLTLIYGTKNGVRASKLSSAGNAVIYYINDVKKETRYVSEYSDFIVASGSDFAVPGYTFSGWEGWIGKNGDTWKEGINGGSSLRSYEETIYLYGYNTPNKYNLTINPNGGYISNTTTGAWQTSSITRNFTYNESTPFCIYYKNSLFENLAHCSDPVCVSIPYRYGYEFGGWTITSGGGQVTYGIDFNTNYYSYNFNGKNVGNVTISAVWIPVYKITLDSQSATTAGTSVYYEKYNYGNYARYDVTGSGSVSYRCVTGVSSVTIPKKTGYNFRGYYTAPNGGGTKYVSETGAILSSKTTFTADTTLYAYWTPIEYNIQYNKDLTDN